MACARSFAQTTPMTPGAPLTLGNAPRPDSSNKTNTNEWRDDVAQIHAFKAWSSKREYPDTSIHTFHRRPFSQPWWRDLGNSGSPAKDLFFTPGQHTGLTLGYHVYDAYRFFVDSLSYYNTTRPYTDFSYQLGSKLEQLAQIMHTQNVKPNWNFTAQYRKLTSPGFYKIQRNNHDNGSLTTNYSSPKQHYQLYAALVYNHNQHDENGGIASAAYLKDSRYDDRSTIPVNFQNDAYSSRRSSVSNNLRDFTAQLQHAYSWGRVDTLYSEDSTQFALKLVPRFSIGHKFELSTEKLQYKDLAPDSLRYISLFTGQRVGQTDSVWMAQKWFYADNAFLLKGFIGPAEKQLEFNAGIGIRIDRFTTDYVRGKDEASYVGNYLTGRIKKEALAPGEWNYRADVLFYFTGQAAGNYVLDGTIGKGLKSGKADIVLGFRSQLNNAPYNYLLHRTQFDSLSASFNKESSTTIHGTINVPVWKLSAGVRTHLISNYLYFNASQRPDQYAPAFNVLQAWARKVFKVGVFVLDNEIAFQQVSGSAPVNVPALMGRHQLSVETYLFRRALKVATGVELRYNTIYAADGYAPFFNRFYYQNTTKPDANPQGSVFFNFKVKRFRAYIMGDQLQEFFYSNQVYADGYPAQNAMFRFGFDWIMIN